MSVRFILGRAGSGKTHHCLAAVREQLRLDPVNGPRLVMLVPEQAGLQMERAIIAPDDIAGAHRAEVLSFQRLAYKVLESSGGRGRRAISEAARAMVLRHLLTHSADRLRYYRRVDRLPGFVDRLGVTITELIQEAVKPERLLEAAAQTPPHDVMGQTKLHDLHLLYSAYLAYLGGERLDASQSLQLAREHLDRCTWLHGAAVWVDGFASFMQQELLILLDLARLGSRMEVTMLIDPKAGASAAKTSAASRLFGKTLRTYRELHCAITDRAVTVEDPLILDHRDPPRFRRNPSLARLEQRLFALPNASADVSNAPAGIEVVELPSRRLEVEYAVSRVCDWVRSRSYRYRDTALAVRDLEPYHDLIGEALASRGIPFFIDRRRPIGHHPLVELLRAGVAMAREDLSLESVRLALKTGLLLLDHEEADELENYLLAHAIQGWQSWRGDDWSFVATSPLEEFRARSKPVGSRTPARINAFRRRLVEKFDPWMALAAPPRSHTGPTWAAALLHWLESLDAAAQLQTWTEQAERHGDPDAAQEHRQVWRETLGFLDDLALAFAEAELPVEELSVVLEAALSRFTLGLAPPMIDQVLVGSIERSRHPDVKAAVLLGFNDGLFPRQHSEDSILHDDDRTAFERAGVRIGSSARERVLDETMLLYIAVTRASEALVVTYATSDGEGKALRPSPYLSALLEACPGITVKTVGDPARSRETWDLLVGRDAVRRLTAEFRRRPSRETDDPVVRGRWNALYETLRSKLRDDSAARFALSSLHERNRPVLSPASVERLLGGAPAVSVSELETQAECPFKHFAEYGLRLRERATAALEPTDVGTVHHALLEDFVGTLSRERRSLGGLSDGELSNGLRDSCARVASRLSPGGARSHPRQAYMLRRSAAHLKLALEAQRRLSRAGRFTPKTVEAPFGYQDRGGLPGLVLATPNGRRVLLRGFIDRIDLAQTRDGWLGLVIDYKKTRDKRLSLDEVYHGLTLQLLGYLLVLEEGGQALTGRPVTPVAGFYLSLAARYESVDHPREVSERGQAFPGAYQPRGLIRADVLPALDAGTEGGGKSLFYSLYRTIKDGSIGDFDRGSDGAEPEDFSALLRHVRRKLAELADRILDGDVSVNPYRLGRESPCRTCPMLTVCRFEMGLSEARFLDKLKRSEVFRRASES